MALSGEEYEEWKRRRARDEFEFIEFNLIESNYRRIKDE
jgi:hypothetical protein